MNEYFNNYRKFNRSNRSKERFLSPAACFCGRCGIRFYGEL